MAGMLLGGTTLAVANDLNPVVQEQQQSIVDMVNVILRTKEINPSVDTKDIENRIDSHVFHLYGLTYDEIHIIDPETSITREDYESKML